jgi:ribosome biogenesis GTPase
VPPGEPGVGFRLPFPETFPTEKTLTSHGQTLIPWLFFVVRIHLTPIGLSMAELLGKEMSENNVRLNSKIHIGTVYKKVIGQYTLRSAEGIYQCSISNRLRKELVYPIADASSLHHRVREVKQIQEVDPVAVGDEVAFVPAGNGDPSRLEGVITEVLPRKSKLVRKAAGNKLLEQVIVANVDQVLITASISQPELKWNLLDRYLVSTESAAIPAVICNTKVDLWREKSLPPELTYYQNIGYPVILTSSQTGENIVELKRVLTGKTTVLVGKSGVGKTSLLNALEDGLGYTVGAVGRGLGKGRHTTSNLEMVDLGFGGRLIDTPGMREFGIWQPDADLAACFPDLRLYAGKCRYGISCQHIRENGCAVRSAVTNGSISQRRYDSFIKLLEEG